MYWLVVTCPSAGAQSDVLPFMERRRFQDERPITYEEGLTALIVMGVCLIIGAIFATCFLALSFSPAATWRELWLSGQLRF